jgi:predicted TPR repeat methyltransferase
MFDISRKKQNLRQRLRSYVPNFTLRLLRRYLRRDCKVLLDVGCGKNSPVKYLPNSIEKIGIDIFEPYLEIARKNNTHDKYVHGDIRYIDRYFPKGSIDCVFCVGVVEHLQKDEAIFLIKKMESIAKKQVFLGTTSGFVEQGSYDDNDFQKHVCSFDSIELKSMGYKVLGTDGLRSIRVNQDGTVKKIGIPLAIIATLTDPILRYFPQFSFNLFAYKKIDGNK